MRPVYLAVATVAVLTLSLLWLQGRSRDARVAWEARAVAALEQSARDRQSATEARHRADEAQQRAVRAESAADSIAQTRRQVVERIRTVTVPAEAIPYTAPRDTAIALLTAEVDTLRVALAERRVESDALRLANATLAGNVARLEAVLRERPRPERRWMPVIVVGVSAGVGADLRPFAGPAVSVGWRVRL
jgi:hypothetical protein